jgi:DNA-binding CsgD family transcriptional regulator
MASVTASEVVGREEELALLSAFLVDVAEGPNALVLQGGPGIGKTTIWQAGVVAARERSCHVLASRPAGAEAQLSFAALGDLLEGVLEETLSELPQPQRRALEVALLLEEPGEPPPDHRAVALAVLRVLRLLVRSRPVVVAVDDLQWLDGPTASVLGFALRRLGSEPVGLLAALRTDDGQTAPGELEQVLSGQRVRRLAVPALSVGALHRLIRSRLGVAFPRPTLLRVHEASGGNPFYALELADALERQEGVESRGRLPIPASLHDLVRARLSALPAEAHELLLAVAAIAQPTVDIVGAALDDAERAARALEESERAGIIDLQSDRIRFTHPLLASVLYSESAAPERQRLHRRLAEVVHDPEERARHLALASARPDAYVASSLDEGAVRACARGAPDAAAELEEQALRLTPPEQKAEIRLRRLAAAAHYFTAGDMGRARVLLEDALADSPRGRQRAEVLAKLAAVRGEAEGARVMAELGRSALAQAEGDARFQADSNLKLAWAANIGESARLADTYARAAVELAEGLGDRSMLAVCLAWSASIDFKLGRGVQLETMERALALERSCEHIGIDIRPSTLLGWQLTWAGDLARARVLLEAAGDRARMEGDTSLAVVLFNLTFLELLAGDWKRAARYADEGYELAEESGRDLTINSAAKAVVAAYLGIADSARSAAQETIAGVQQPLHAQLGRWALGHLELSLGNPAAARQHFQLATDSIRALEIEEPAMLFWFPLEVVALIEVGELDEAEALLDWVEERALRLDRAWALATSHRGRGLLAAARGDPPGAFAAFELALAEHERVPQRFEHAGTLLALGQTQRRVKQKRAARESLGAALAIFEELGAALWAKKARAELARIGGRAPAAGELTPTERRVAELVAEGHTNREVAAALFVTVRAVEWNLSNIYRKLGLRSRTELARHSAVTASGDRKS